MIFIPPKKNNSGSDALLQKGKLSPRQCVLRGAKLLGLQFTILVIITVVFDQLNLDRTIASYFYDPVNKWFLGHHPIWTMLYYYGTFPGILLALICLVAWLVSFFNHRLESWRPYLLLVVLTTAIAGGLLVNTVFKGYWGRPRPNQITEFGGYYHYRNIFPPGIPGKGASFPCGHSAMGFTFFSLVFMHRRSKKTAYTGLALGIGLGGALSAARLVKGAHFPTDIIWSLGMVLMTATALYYGLQKIPARKPSTQNPDLKIGKKIALILMVSLIAGVMSYAFMTRRPFYKTKRIEFPVENTIHRLEIHINADPERLTVRAGNSETGIVLVHARGFGWAYVDYRMESNFHSTANTLSLNIHIDARSYFAELDHSLEVILPPQIQETIQVEVMPRTDARDSTDSGSMIKDILKN